MMKLWNSIKAGVLLIWLFLSSCGAPLRAESIAENALQEKYKENFEITYVDFFYGRNPIFVEAHSEMYPDLVFDGLVDIKTHTIEDSYVSKRVCDRLSAKIHENLEKNGMSSGYYVYTETMLDKVLQADPEASLEEFLADGSGNQFYIYLTLLKDSEDSDTDAAITDTLSHMLDDIEGIRGYLVIYQADINMFGKIQSYLKTHSSTDFAFEEMTQEACIGITKIEEGKFSLSQEMLKNFNS